ncbi:DUF4129 domain-containing protein [bacterium]|nr:DUF4129 domain-containing protein [bacterium]
MLVDEVSSSVQLLNPAAKGAMNYQVESRISSPAWQEIPPLTIAEYADLPVNEGGAMILDAPFFLRRRDTPPATRRFAEFLSIYTQLPDVADMATVSRLATEWTGELTSAREKAERIEHRLRNYYSYSLDTDFASRSDHLSYFLTDGKAGHCEYFATAMVLMLRSQKVPARVVNGYATDEWVSGSNGYYIVRQEHAHSWVEVWFPEAGWITFDPTPASGIGNNRLPNTLYRRLTRWYDVLKFQWYDKIIDFDARDQTGMMMAMFRGINRAAAFGGGLGSFMTGDGDSNVGFVGTTLVLVVIVGGVVAAVILFRKRRRRQIEIERAGETLYPKDAPIEDYRLLLERLQQLHPRAPSSTPLEYAREIVVSQEPLGDFLPLTERYYGARYDGALWSDSEAHRARALLRLIETRAETPTTREQSPRSPSSS